MIFLFTTNKGRTFKVFEVGIEEVATGETFDKSEEMFLHEDKLVYLGFVISQDGLKMDPEKVKAIKEWPSPRNIYEVRSFHGLKVFIENSLEILVEYVLQ
jgi:hypothetical protein